MPLWPTLCGVNLWLVALAVPLLLAGRGAGGFVLAAAPLAPLCLFVGLRYRGSTAGQLALLCGVPLLALLPAADGSLADPRLLPRPAVVVQLALLFAYVAAVCRMLAAEGRGRPKLAAAGRPWQVTPLPAQDPSGRLKRRIFTHRLLVAYTVAVPALLLYAIDLHPANLRTLRQAFGSLRRVAAMQATLTAGATVLCSVVFYFCIMAPLASYLDHHRELRGDLSALRRQARRGRPRAVLYLYMLGALLGMIFLILWSLRS